MKRIVALSLLALASAGFAQTAGSIATTKSGPIAAPAPGKGQIVFYRPGSMLGMALGCTVREGEGAAETQIARLGSGKYWVHEAAPGRHAYRTEGEVRDTLNLEVEPGETYFVKCRIGAGIAAGRANLSPSDQAEFAEKAKGLKLWDAKPGEAGKRAGG